MTRHRHSEEGHEKYQKYLQAADEELQRLLAQKLKLFATQLDRAMSERLGNQRLPPAPNASVPQPPLATSDPSRLARGGRWRTPVIASAMLVIGALIGIYIIPRSTPAVMRETTEVPLVQPGAPVPNSAANSVSDVQRVASEIVRSANELSNTMATHRFLFLDPDNPALAEYQKTRATAAQRDEKLIALITQRMLNGVVGAHRVAEDGLMKWTGGKPDGETGTALLAYFEGFYLSQRNLQAASWTTLLDELSRDSREPLRLLHNAVVNDFLQGVR